MSEKLDERALLVAIRAHDKEDASQRGEPDPWEDDFPEPFLSERMACMGLAITAYLSTSSGSAAPVAWMPIDTAPKDGSYIWLANENIMRLAFWRDGSQHENHGTEGGGWIDKALAEAGGVRGLTFAPTLWHPWPSHPRAALLPEERA